MAGNFEHQKKDRTIFLMDSGSSDQLINDDTLFASFVILPEPINISVAKI